MATTELHKLPAALSVIEMAKVLRMSPKTILRRAKSKTLKGCTGGNVKGKPIRVSTSAFKQQFKLSDADLSSALLS